MSYWDTFARHRMLKIQIKYIFFIPAALMLAFAQGQNAPKYSNEFLSIGVGARALGMANSVVASGDDVTSGYWNPAALTQIEHKAQGSLMHAAYFAGMANYDYGAVAIPIEKGVLGVSLIRFGVDDIMNTVDLIDPSTGQPNYNRITKFSAADYAALISFARELPVEGLSMGGNLKVIYRQIGNFAEAWGFGVDAAIHYKRNGWMLGGVLRDGTSTFNAWSFSLDDRTQEVFLETGNELPENDLELTLPRFIFGAAKKIYLNNERFSILPEVNVETTFDGRRNVLFASETVSWNPHMGIEAGFLDFIFLRGGVGNIQREPAFTGTHDTYIFQPNFGVGLYFKDVFGVGNIAIDYALTDVGSTSGLLYSNIFSLKFDFTK